ncbi:hypothetical protein BKA64DRAFT_666567 [Cadophora sp. MPI-SDFR-AT-0126]|nr:hypothetical protein BKA64DRAFT_666567 [Leotiomycetes sp. MPI-SDFR-AT-0126]
MFSLTAYFLSVRSIALFQPTTQLTTHYTSCHGHLPQAQGRAMNSNIKLTSTLECLRKPMAAHTIRERKRFCLVWISSLGRMLLISTNHPSYKVSIIGGCRLNSHDPYASSP